jgi:putative endopeptidase
MSDNSPQKDFYSWVNEKWFNDPKNDIPPDYSTWGGFIKLYDEGIKNQINLVKDLDNNHKIKIIWDKCIDQFNYKTDNYKPIEDEFKILNKILPEHSINGLGEYIAYCNQNCISTVFSLDKGADLEDSTKLKLDIAPSGLSLPGRKYYFEDNFIEQRKLFKQHLINVERIVGKHICLEDNFVEKVLQFENMLAYITMTSEQSRDYDKYYTNTNLVDFYKNMDKLNFNPDKLNNYLDDEKCEKLNQYLYDDIEKCMEKIYSLLDLRLILTNNFFKTTNSTNIKGKYYLANDNYYYLVVYDGDYFRKIFPILFSKDNFSLFRAYQQYKIIKYTSTYCSKELNDEFFDFYSRKLGGQKEQKPVEKKTIDIINSWVGELMGELYVNKYFSLKDKKNVEDMIYNILDIMKKSLKENDWLTDRTKLKALEKLNKFGIKIGFPEKWKKYNKLSINDSDTLYDIRKKVIQFNYYKEFVKKINTSVDKKEWHMTPQTVNAYFSPQNNEIVFPAAILQPPFYHKSDETVDFPIDQYILDYCTQHNLDITYPINLGGIGAVIAHEITHGYDDSGRKFDGDGNLNNWWNDEDLELFKKKTDIMANQASKYEYLDGENIHKMNSHLTMGENIADLGGLTLSMKSLLKHTPKIHHKHLLHLFFKSWANVWKFKASKQAIINRLATDPHAPPSFRGNMVSNIDEFYTTFDVTDKDNMYIKPENRVKIY